MRLRKAVAVMGGQALAVPGKTRSRPQLGRIDVDSSERLLTALNDTRRDVQELSEAASAGELSPLYFDVTAGTLGAPIVLVHNIGRPAHWCVVDWRSDAGGAPHRIERLTTTATTLTLRSYELGEARIRVW